MCLQAIREKPITLRVKRQECKCIRNPRSTGGMTCSCAQPMSAQAPTEALQQTEVAQALSDSVQAHPSRGQNQARCGCVQIVYLGTAQYQCQCGEAPTTTTTTMAPTTLPPTTPPPQYPTAPTDGQGQCQCIMIQISGPTSAQYQCNCNGNQNYPSLVNDAPVVTSPPEITETYPPVTYPPETLATEAPPMIADAVPYQQAAQYPLTTNCVMYVGVPVSSCVCLPQYDPCAQNICCLKAKFRSHKAVATQRNAEPSTVDMLMNILKKIKTKLND
ncbi:hypothetical protein OSTOST_14933 [Ostertagia ostertagi]